MEVRKMRKLILTTASVLALGIGSAGVSFAADLGNTAPNSGANIPAMSQPAQNTVNPSGSWSLSKQDIQQAQEQLRDQGLYHGSIDGILGPETKQSLQQFQQKNGLQVTATLDQQTMDKLLGNPPVGQGSSMPPNMGQPTGPAVNPHPAAPNTNLGDHTAPRQ
jgi:peptidoglycan hydrolase-like protein with peptidoglycan-binding domain